MKNIESQVSEKLGFFSGGFRKKMTYTLLCGVNGEIYYHTLIVLFDDNVPNTTIDIKNNIK